MVDRFYCYDTADGKLQSVREITEAEWLATTTAEEAIRWAAVEYGAYNPDQIVRLLLPDVCTPKEANDAVRHMANDPNYCCLFQATKPISEAIADLLNGCPARLTRWKTVLK